MISRLRLSMAVMLAAAPALALTPIFDDFSTNTSANYVPATTTSNTRGPFTYDGVSAGIGGVAGRLNAPAVSGAPSDGNASFLHTTSIGSFGADVSFSLSIHFLVNPAGSATGNLLFASLGLGNNLSTLLSSNGGTAALHVDLRRNNASPATGTQFALRFRSNDGAAGTVYSPTYVTLSSNTWYQLTLDVTQTSATQFDLAANLFNWGADGVTGGASVLAHSATMTNPSFGASDPLYAGFLARNNPTQDTRNIAVDQFVVVPEPASVWLAAFGLLGLGARGRRRI